MKQMVMRIEDYKQKKQLEKMLKVFAILIAASFLIFMISSALYVAFDMPRAAVADEEIKYFEIPSSDKQKYVRILPGTKKFQELKKGDYVTFNVAPDAFREEMENK